MNDLTTPGKLQYLELDATEWQRKLALRIHETAARSNNLDDEIGVLSVTLERVLQESEGQSLTLISDHVMAITDKLEKLKRANYKMKKDNKQLITEAEAKQLGSALLNVVVKEVNTLSNEAEAKKIIEKISDEFLLVFQNLSDGKYEQN